MTNCGQRALSEIGHGGGAKHNSKIETAVKIGVDQRSGTSTQRYTKREEGEGWRERDEGDANERRERMRLRDFAPVRSQPQRTNGGPDGVGLCNMASAVIGAREIVRKREVGSGCAFLLNTASHLSNYILHNDTFRNISKRLSQLPRGTSGSNNDRISHWPFKYDP